MARSAMVAELAGLAAELQKQKASVPVSQEAPVNSASGAAPETPPELETLARDLGAALAARSQEVEDAMAAHPVTAAAAAFLLGLAVGRLLPRG